MKRKHLLLLLLAMFSVATIFTACGDDDDDDTLVNNNPNNNQQQPNNNGNTTDPNGGNTTDPNNGNTTDPNGGETGETKITSANVSDFLKGQAAGSTVEVKLDETTPDFAKLREALSANANVNVKLDLSACTGLTEIPENAFFNPSVSKNTEVSGTGFDNLVAIILPETIQKIANNAFRGCGKLVAIVIPKSVVEIAQNAFIGCENLTEIVNNSTIAVIVTKEDPGQEEDPDPNPNEEIDIDTDPDAPIFVPETTLPRKIVKIEYHEMESGYEQYDKVTTYTGFVYDAEGRLISFKEKYGSLDPVLYIFKYTKSGITYTDYGDEVVLTFDGNRVASYEFERVVSNCGYSADGILQSITTKDGTLTFTIENGLITSFLGTYPKHNEQEDYKIEYSNAKNNLNIDVCNLLFDILQTSFFGDAFGKRMPYLPSKITGTYTCEGETELDNYSFEYEFEGDYLKAVTILNYGEEGEVYSVEQYVFYFED